MKIVLIGSGNVATRFGIAFKEAGHQVLQVYSRKKSNALKLATKLHASYTNDQKSILKDADFYFIALTDTATNEFLKKFNPGNGIAVHTSGSLPLKSFQHSVSNCGVIWPMKSFTKSENVQMNEVTFFIEGSNARTEKFLMKLAHSFSKSVFKVNSKQRLSIHLAAVFANNFPNHLLHLAEKILKKNGLSLSLLYPMIENSVKKLKSYSPAELQTGPAKRHDTDTLKAHLKYLEESPELKKVYSLMTKSIQKESE